MRKSRLTWFEYVMFALMCAVMAAVVGLIDRGDANAFSRGRGGPIPAPSVSASPFPSQVPAPTGVPSGLVPSPAPAASPYPHLVTLKCDGTCNAEEVAELPAIEAAMNRTLTSQCFANYFKTPGRRLDLAQGKTPDQILGILRQPITLTINYFYRTHTKEEGYESADDFAVIHFNRFYTQAWPTCTKASLGLHEMTHARGFWHNGNKAGPNWHTIPYSANHATEGDEDWTACCGEAK